MAQTVSINQKLSKRLLLMLASVGLLAFCGIVAETAMNVTFATLMEEFSISTASVQWVTSAYLLVLTIVVPLSSHLNKNVCERRNFLFACITYTAGDVICIIAWNFPILILGRVIAGVGLGIAIPLMFHMIMTHVPRRIQGTIMGVANFICCISPAFGPSIGGVIITYQGWRYIFVLLLPLLILSLILGLISIRKTQAPMHTSFDMPGYIIIGLVFALIVLAAGLAGSFGWVSVPVIVLLVLAVVCALLYYLHFKRSDMPIINIHVFRYKPFLFGSLAILMVQFNALCFGILIPNYSQLVNGNTAAIAGMLVLPGSVISAVLMPFSGRIYDKKGPRIPFIIGCIFLMFATAMCAVFGLRLDSVTLALGYAVYCIGVGFIVSNVLTTSLQSVPSELTPDGNAMYNTLQQLGGALGTAVISSLVAASQTRISDMATATAIGSRHGFILQFLIACGISFCLFSAIRHLKRHPLTDQ